MQRPTNKRKDPTTLRGILLFVIIATIPLYICGIGVWLFNAPNRSTNNTPPPPDYEEPTTTPQGGVASRTPIDPFALLTELALTNPPPQQQITSIPTISVGVTFEPIIITITSEPIFTTPTLIPTRFNTSTPTPTFPPPTITPTLAATVAQPTAPPQPTQPILLPPTDTPAP